MAWNRYMRHRPVMRDGTVLRDWGTWHEAAAELTSRGLATYVWGIFTMHPGVTIEGEGFYA